MIIFNVGYYVVFTYLPNVLHQDAALLQDDRVRLDDGGRPVALVLILPLAALSDRIGRRPLLIAGALGFAMLAYPLFLVLNSGSVSAAIAAHCALAAIEAVFVSAAVTAGVELFGTRVRYSGFSIGYNIAVAGFGGTTPYIATWLTGQTGNPLAVSFYLTAAAVVSLLTVLRMPETSVSRLVPR